MTMDVSSLGIEVKSTGIKEASQALSGLGTSAANAETKVTRLTDAIERLLKQNVTATMQAWAASMQAMSNAMNSVGSGAQGYATALTSQANAAQQSSTVTNTLNQQFNNQANILVNLTNTVNNYAAAANNASNASGGWAARAGVMLNTLKAMTAAFLYYKTIELGRSIVEDADKWTLLNTRMITATGSQNNATVAMGDAYRIAQQLALPLDTTIKLYTRLAPAMAQMGHDSKDTNAVVLGLSSALRLGGASTAEANASMTQFSHAMSAGSFNMREYNSLSREAPVLLRAMADQMTNGNMHALKLLMGQGKVTANETLKAIEAAQPKWNQMLNDMPITVEGAMTRVKNAWLKSIGEMAQDNGFNTQLAKGISILQDMIPGIVRAIGAAFTSVMTWINANKDGLMEVGRQLGGIIKDVWALGTAFMGVFGTITTGTGSVSMLGLLLFTARVILAGIVDIVKEVAASFLDVGLAITDIVLAPLVLLLALVENVTKAFGDFAGWIAKMAPDGGKLQSTMAAVADAVHKSADRAGDAATQVAGLTEKGHQMVGELDKGANSMDKLLSGTEDVGEAFDNMQKKALKYNKNFNQHPENLVDPKLIAAQNKEINKQQEAIAALNTEYEKLMATQQSLQDGSNGLKVGPAQTEELRLENELKAVKDKVALLNKQQILNDIESQLVLAKRNAEVEMYNELLQKQDAAQKKQIDKEQTLTGTLKDQLKALQERNAAYKNPNGKSDMTTNAADVVQAKLDAAQGNLNNPSFVEGASTTELENQQKLVKVYQEQLIALGQIADEQKIISQNKLSDEWDKMFDPKKAQKFGSELTKAFGTAGTAFGKLFDRFTKYTAEMDKLAKAQKIVDETNDPALKQQRQLQLNLETTKEQIASYGDMADAAKGFFKEGTTGYKIMGDVERGFRVVQMALQLEQFAVQMGLITATTAAKLTGDAAMAGSSVVAAGVISSANMAIGGTAATAGIATQAMGDPYTAFPRMAAMAAAMLALGFAVSSFGGGGSGAHLAADRQAAAGTGTTLGDASKQSESISKSIGLLASNSNIGLRYSEGMLSALQSIQSALTGTASQILQSGGAITGSDFTGATHVQGAIQGGISGLKGLFSGKTLTNPLAGLLQGAGFGSAKSLVDSGITSGSQTVGSVESSGFSAKAYQDIETQKKAFWTTYSDKVSRTTTTLDPAVTNSFTNIIKNMASTVEAAGTALGMSADDIKAKLASVTISLGDISLKGLTGDQIEKQLETVFSAFGDKLVQAGLGTMLAKFQQAGEGLLQTAVRVAAGVDTAAVELNKLGLTAINFSDIINTNGDIGAEIVRQSIMVKEAGSGIGEIINSMSGDAGTIGDTYTSLLALRTSLVDLGVAKDVTRDLINAAGGLSTFQSALDSYKKNFFSAAEQNAMDAGDLSKQFAALGLTMPKTKAGFRSLVDSLSASGATGQALATKVILLSDAFNNLSSTVDTAVADATSNLTDAYNAQVTVLTNAKTAFDGFATSLKTFKQSLMTGDLSTLSGLQKYQAEKALYEETQRKAAQGDQTALSNFQQVAQDFLTASRGVNASGEQYTADYNEVLQQTDALQQYSAGQSSVQDQQLTALQQQVNGLITINSSVLTVTQAIQALQSLIATGVTSSSPGFSFNGVPTPTSHTDVSIMPVSPSANGSHLAGLGMVPFDGYLAQLHKGERVLTAQESRAYQQNAGSSNADLVAELRDLKATVAALRDGQREQTANLVAATYDSNAQNADAIVEGHKEVAKDTSYNQRAKATLA